MKKLLAVCFFSIFASVLSAASVNWMLNPKTVMNPSDSSTGLKGSLVYLMQGSSADASATYTAIQNNTWTNTSALASLLTNPVGGGSATSEIASLDAGNYYDFYVVVFDAGTMDDATNFMVSGIVNAQAGDGATIPGTKASWNANTISATSGAWTSLSTNPGEDPTAPEPTALALLALGVAGLALKRKVA